MSHTRLRTRELVDLAPAASAPALKLHRWAKPHKYTATGIPIYTRSEARLRALG